MEFVELTIILLHVAKTRKYRFHPEKNSPDPKIRAATSFCSRLRQIDSAAGAEGQISCDPDDDLDDPDHCECQ